MPMLTVVKVRGDEIYRLQGEQWEPIQAAGMTDDSMSDLRWVDQRFTRPLGVAAFFAPLTVVIRGHPLTMVCFRGHPLTMVWRGHLSDQLDRRTECMSAHSLAFSDG